MREFLLEGCDCCGTSSRVPRPLKHFKHLPKINLNRNNGGRRQPKRTENRIPFVLFLTAGRTFLQFPLHAQVESLRVCVCVCAQRSVCLCLMSTFDFWQVNCNVRGSSSSMKKQRFRHVNNWRAQPQCDSRGRSANRQTEAESVGPQTGAASGTHKTQVNKWKAWLPFAFTFDFFQSYFISGTLFACLPHQFQFY